MGEQGIQGLRGLPGEVGPQGERGEVCYQLFTTVVKTSIGLFIFLAISVIFFTENLTFLSLLFEP